MISEAVRQKLSEAVELWAEDNLPGRPAILGAGVFSSLEKALQKSESDIERVFPLKDGPSHE